MWRQHRCRTIRCSSWRWWSHCLLHQWPPLRSFLTGHKVMVGERNEGEGALETSGNSSPSPLQPIFDVAHAAIKCHKSACILSFARVLEVAHAAGISHIIARTLSIARGHDVAHASVDSLSNIFTSIVAGTGRLGDRWSVCKFAGITENIFNAKVSVINPNA